jgi:hypothetical protein
MPNWMRTALEVSGDQKLQEKFFNAIGQGLESEQPIDFEKIIPPPDNLFRGNIGNDEQKYCKDNNLPNWYDWNRENWGTKWNASYCELRPSKQGDSTVLLFETAWSLPLPIFEKIEQMLMNEFIGLNIYGEFIEEGNAVAGVVLMDKDGADIRELEVDESVFSDEEGGELNYHLKFLDQDGCEFKFKNL